LDFFFSTPAEAASPRPLFGGLSLPSPATNKAPFFFLP
jgi:hypothetical protein